MAGSRPLTFTEERSLVRIARKMNARDRALIMAQAFTGYRISEVLSLTIGQVAKNGQILDKVGVRPAFLKGNYGNTRWVPIGPELRRALEDYLSRRSKNEDLAPTAPLFLSREHDSFGRPKALSRSSAEKIIGAALRSIAESDPELLSTHSLRKSYAQRLYDKSGKDILLVRDGLGHSSIAVTQIYLNVNRNRLEETMRACDWSRKSRRTSKPVVVAAKREPVLSAMCSAPAAYAVKEPVSEVQLPVQTPSGNLCLPGFENF